MRFMAVVVAGFAFGASMASSAFVGRRSAFNGALLEPRQDDTCTQACTAFQTSETNCTTTTCFCTSAVALNLQICIDCALAGSPTEDIINDAETLLSDFNTACTGVDVPVITLPNTSVSTVTASSATVTLATGAGRTTTSAFSLPTSASDTLPSPSAFSQITIRSTSAASTSPAQTAPAAIKSDGTVSNAAVFSSVKDGIAFALLSMGVVIGVNLLL